MSNNNNQELEEFFNNALTLYKFIDNYDYIRETIASMQIKGDINIQILTENEKLKLKLGDNVVVIGQGSVIFDNKTSETKKANEDPAL